MSDLRTLISSRELLDSSNSVILSEQSTFFRENGYTQPFCLDSLENIATLLKITQKFERVKKQIKRTIPDSPSNNKFKQIRRQLKIPAPWLLYGDRNAHIFSKLVFDLATDKAILDMLSICLGENILIWLGQVITRTPQNQGQSWHIDQINWRVSGVHASIAITDMTLENGCLQVIPKTHLYNLSQTELETKAKLFDISLWDGEAMVELANRLHPENAPHQLVSLEIKAGQSFLMQGGLWHGVPGNTTNQPRVAVVARYMRPDVTSEESGCPLPCILIAGQDNEKKNTLCCVPKSWFKQDVFLNYQLNKLSYQLTKLVHLVVQRDTR